MSSLLHFLDFSTKIYKMPTRFICMHSQIALIQ
jgi:hypothetical protein